MGKKYVYSFGANGAEGNKDMKDTLGGKGANLAEMCNAKLPVPPGFTVSTEVCNIYFNNNRQVPAEVDDQIRKALAKVEAELGKKLGDPSKPLLLSVRSGAKFSMPGMMNTILNLGLNDETTEALAEQTGNPRFAYDCYRRFIQMFGEVALEHRNGAVRPHFRCAQGEDQGEARHRFAGRRPAGHHHRLQESRKEGDRQGISRRTPGRSSPCLATPCSAPGGQTRPRYYRKMEKIPDELGTAANIQAMVFGNLGETSGTGVGFTRDPGSRRASILRRVPVECAGRRRGRRYPYAAPDLRSRARNARCFPAAI